jgi:hypothetical protein
MLGSVDTFSREAATVIPRFEELTPDPRLPIPDRVLHDLHIRISRDDREGGIVEIEIGLALDLLARLPPDLDDADLGQQHILDEGIEREEARVLLHEDVIDIVRFLLGRIDVLGPDRLEPHHLIAGGEKISISEGIGPSIVSATSVETVLERPSGAGTSRAMSPR